MRSDPIAVSGGDGDDPSHFKGVNFPVVCRSAYRFGISPDGALNNFGFRVVLVDF